MSSIDRCGRNRFSCSYEGQPPVGDEVKGRPPEVVREEARLDLKADELQPNSADEAVVSTTEAPCEGQPPVSDEVEESVAAPAQETGADILALSLNSFNRIKGIYEQFQIVRKVPEEDFNEAVLNLLNLKNYYLNARASDPDSAEGLKQNLELATSQVREMNKTNALTMYDFVVLGSFFTPPDPREGPYVDETTGERYVRPNSSELLSFGSEVKQRGEYKDVGLAREEKFTKCDELGRPEEILCDYLYLEKTDKQVKFECGEPYRGKPSDIHEIKRKQENLLGEIISILKERVKIWGYKSFIVCDKTKLMEYGIDEKYAKKFHGILFVYKKL